MRGDAGDPPRSLLAFLNCRVSTALDSGEFWCANAVERGWCWLCAVPVVNVVLCVPVLLVCVVVCGVGVLLWRAVRACVPKCVRRGGAVAWSWLCSALEFLLNCVRALWRGGAVAWSWLCSALSCTDHERNRETGGAVAWSWLCALGRCRGAGAKAMACEAVSKGVDFICFNLKESSPAVIAWAAWLFARKDRGGSNWAVQTAPADANAARCVVEQGVVEQAASRPLGDTLLTYATRSVRFICVVEDGPDARRSVVEDGDGSFLGFVEWVARNRDRARLVRPQDVIFLQPKKACEASVKTRETFRADRVVVVATRSKSFPSATLRSAVDMVLREVAERKTREAPNARRDHGRSGEAAGNQRDDDVVVVVLLSSQSEEFRRDAIAEFSACNAGGNGARLIVALFDIAEQSAFDVSQ